MKQINRTAFFVAGMFVGSFGLTIGMLFSNQISVSLAQTVPATPPTPTPTPRQISPVEEIARFKADFTEALRQLNRCSNELMGSNENAAADHEELEAKLNGAVAHIQELDKQLVDLKAKYEPAVTPK